MQINLNVNQKLDKSLDFLLQKMPANIRSALNNYLDMHKIFVINELRIHVCSNMKIVSKERILNTDIFINETDIKSIVSSLCDNSVYAHAQTLKNGYIRVGKGIRAGVCGRAVTENEGVLGLFGSNV